MAGRAGQDGGDDERHPEVLRRPQWGVLEQDRVLKLRCEDVAQDVAEGVPPFASVTMPATVMASVTCANGVARAPLDEVAQGGWVTSS